MLFLYQGNALNKLGEEEEAHNNYTKAIMINPQYSEAYIGRGR